MPPLVSETVRCPACASSIRFEKGRAVCEGCKKVFRHEGGKLFLTDQPGDAPIPKKDLEYMLDQSHWSDWRRSNYRHLLAQLKSLPKDARILDLAAGRSPFRHGFNDSFSNILSTDFVAYDLVDVVADTSGKLPFADAAFDAVVVSNVLEHMPDPVLTIAECYRLLKPGGLFIAHTPFLMELHDEPYDFYRYTKYAAHRLLEDAGFTSIVIEPLSDFYDVYRSLTRDFFHEQLAAARGYRRTFLRALRKAHSGLLWLFAPWYRGLIGERHPRGYGWVGKKAHSV
jgi:SAM-dependent methyltransferase